MIYIKYICSYNFKKITTKSLLFTLLKVTGTGLPTDDFIIFETNIQIYEGKRI